MSPGADCIFEAKRPVVVVLSVEDHPIRVAKLMGDRFDAGVGWPSAALCLLVDDKYIIPDLDCGPIFWVPRKCTGVTDNVRVRKLESVAATTGAAGAGPPWQARPAPDPWAAHPRRGASRAACPDRVRRSPPRPRRERRWTRPLVAAVRRRRNPPGKVPRLGCACSRRPPRRTMQSKASSTLVAFGVGGRPKRWRRSLNAAVEGPDELGGV